MLERWTVTDVKFTKLWAKGSNYAGSEWSVYSFHSYSEQFDTSAFNVCCRKKTNWLDTDCQHAISWPCYTFLHVTKWFSIHSYRVHILLWDAALYSEERRQWRSLLWKQQLISSTHRCELYCENVELFYFYFVLCSSRRNGCKYGRNIDSEFTY